MKLKLFLLKKKASVDKIIPWLLWIAIIAVVTLAVKGMVARMSG